jgi:hypothetical protein
VCPRVSRAGLEAKIADAAPHGDHAADGASRAFGVLLIRRRMTSGATR